MTQHMQQAEQEGEARATYYVWPDNTKQNADDEPPYSWKSDDYLTVSLTEEQADLMNYNQIVAAIVSGSKMEVSG